MYEVVEERITGRARWALILERWHPHFFGVVSGFVAFRFLRGETLPNLQQVFASTIDLGAIALGFVITVKTILLGMRGTAAHAWVDASGLGPRFSRLLIDTAYLIFILVVLSLGMVLLQGLLLPESTVIGETARPKLAILSLAVWLGASLATGLGCIQVIRIFFLMLAPRRRRLSPPPPNTEIPPE